MNITLEFLTHTRRLSFTSFHEFCLAPAKYLHYITKVKEPDTDDLIIGKMVHTLSLEPDKASQYVALPKFDMRKTKDKEDALLFLEDNKDKIVVNPDIYDKSNRMAEAILKHPFAKQLLGSPGTPEQKWEGDINELPFVGYVDKMLDLGAKLEIKTVQNADKDSIERDFYGKGYPIQFGLYDIARPTQDNYYICVEKKPPYIVNVMAPTPDYMEYGKTIIARKTEDFKHCMMMGDFSQGYEIWNGGEMEQIGIPRWAKRY